MKQIWKFSGLGALNPHQKSNFESQFTVLLEILNISNEKRETLNELMSGSEKADCIKAGTSILEQDPHFSSSDEETIRVMRSRKTISSLNLVILKYRIENCDKIWNKAFCAAGGVSAIVECIDSRLHVTRFLEADAAALYELLLCMRAMMKTDGLKTVLDTRGGIDAIIMSLNFRYKPLALLVLEILSVTLFFVNGRQGGELMVWQIMQGIHHSAKRSRNLPFEMFVSGLVDGDEEQQAAIVEFVTILILSEPDFYRRVEMRNALESVGFGREVSRLVRGDPEETSSSVRNSLSTMDSRSHRMIRGVSFRTSSDDSLKIRQEAKVKGLAEDGITVVHPEKGVMEGCCIKLKKPKVYHMDSFSTKRRWYRLSDGVLYWWKERDPRQSRDSRSSIRDAHQLYRESNAAGHLDMSVVESVQSYTTSENILNKELHAFEIILGANNNEQKLKMAVTDELTKERWMIAIHAAVSNAYRHRAMSSMDTPDLSETEEEAATLKLKTQAQIYEDLAAEDKAKAADEGVKYRDPSKLARIVSHMFFDHEPASAKREEHRFDSDNLTILLMNILNKSPDTASAKTLWSRLLSHCDKDIISNLEPGKGDADERSTVNTLRGSPHFKWKRAVGKMKSSQVVSVSTEENDKHEGTDLVESFEEVQGEQPSQVERALRRWISGKKQSVVTGSGESSVEELLAENDALRKKLKMLQTQMSQDTPTLKLPTSTVPGVSSEAEKEKALSPALVSKQCAVQTPARSPLPPPELPPAWMKLLHITIPSTQQPDSSSSAAPKPSSSGLPVAVPLPRRKPQSPPPLPSLWEKLLSPDMSSPVSTQNISPSSSSARPHAVPKPRRQPPIPPKFPDEWVKILQDACPRPTSSVPSALPVAISFPSQPLQFSLPTRPTAGLPPPPPKGALQSKPNDGLPDKQKLKPSCKLKGLFWTKLKAPEVKQSVWITLVEPELSWKEVEEAFRDEADARKASVESATASITAPAKTKNVSLFDGKRTQNVSIACGKIRKSPADISDMILDMDPEVLTKDLCETLSPLVPTPDELNAVVAYEGPKTELDIVGKLFLSIGPLPRVRERIKIQLMTFNWPEHASVLAEDLDIMHFAVEEWLSKEAEQAMKTVLSLILALGNYMNGGTARGQAVGVKIDILTKIGNIKQSGTNKGLTLLHFIGEWLNRKSPQALEFFDTCSYVYAAAKISLKQLETTFKELERDLAVAQKEREDILLLGDKLKPERMREPYLQRINEFVKASEQRLSFLRKQFGEIDANATALRLRYGESGGSSSAAGGTEGECQSQAFFSILAQFATSLKKAAQDNAQRKEAIERAAKKEEEKRLSAERKAAAELVKVDASPKLKNLGVESPQSSRRGSADDEDGGDVYNKFKEAQAGGAGNLMALFRQRMDRQRAHARATSESTLDDDNDPTEDNSDSDEDW